MPSALTLTPRRRRLAFVPIAGLAVGVVLAAALPAVSASAAPTIVAADGFSRTTSTGWGTAFRGGQWSTSMSGRAKATVSDGRGHFDSVAPGTSAEALLPNTKMRNVDVSATIRIPSKAAATYTAVELRRQSDGTQYRGRLEVGRGGSVVISVTKIVKNSKTKKKTEVGLGKVVAPIWVKPGDDVNVEFRAVGTTKVSVAGRAWVGSGVAPAWQISKTDGSSTRISASGAIGFWQYSGKENKVALTTSFDTLVVTKDPTSAPATTAPPAGGVVTPVTPANPSAPTASPTPSSEPTTPASPTTPTAPAAPAGPVSPDPVTTPSVFRGSVPVGTADYPIPASGVVYVSPSGSDSNSGSIGSPKQTVQAAVSAAKSGNTVVMRAGVYNEHVDVPTNKKLTIQSYPHEAVWFDGSKQVTSWTPSGSTWTTPWNFFPSSVMQGIADNPRFVDPAFPLASKRDQAFVNGVPLTQVAKASDVRPGTFAVNASAKTVTIGNDPAGQEVRISNVGQAIKVNSIGTTLRGFGVRRFATSSEEGGAIKLANVGATAQNLVITNNASIGINVENNDTTLDHLTVLHAGLMGVGANAAYNFVLKNSIVNYNNDQQFKAAPVSGGFKITRSRGVTITNNEVSHNLSSGIWLDESVYDATITGNTVNDDKYVAISLELSQKVVVADNYMDGSYSGITVQDTGDVQIYNNMIGGTTQFGVQARQDERRASQLATEGHDPRRPKPDPTVSWVTEDVMIANNVFGAGTGYQVYALNAAPKKITVTGNVFNKRLTSKQSTLVAWGGADTSKFVRYDTPESINAGINSAWKNIQTTGVMPISSMAPMAAASTSIATPLPADVAALIGQRAGVRQVGTFQ